MAADGWRLGIVLCSLAVGVYHRINGISRCRGALYKRDGSVDAARSGRSIGVAHNGVSGGGCVLAVLV